MSWSKNRIYDNGGRIVLPVKQKHLDFAVERSSACCAIATAVRDAVPDARRISVDLMWIKFTRHGKRVRAPTPAVGRECIQQLDAGNVSKVAPFVLKLRPEFREQRLRPARAAARRIERAVQRNGLAQPPKPRKPSVTVAVLSERENGLRVYKRREARPERLGKPSPPPRPVPPPQMTKSELRREFEKAWGNTAALQPQPSMQDHEKHLSHH